MRLNTASPVGKSVRYITIAFITHLVHHFKGIPIIDQHNFRAMNYFTNNLYHSHILATNKAYFICQQNHKSKIKLFSLQEHQLNLSKYYICI